MAVADLATPTPAPPGHRHDDVGEERGEEDVCVDEHKRLGGGEVHCVVKEGAQRRGRGGRPLGLCRGLLLVRRMRSSNETLLGEMGCGLVVPKRAGVRTELKCSFVRKFGFDWLFGRLVGRKCQMVFALLAADRRWSARHGQVWCKDGGRMGR